MNKKEAQETVATMLANGIGKTATFNRLTGQGVSDRQIAHFIASYADPKLCEQNEGLINGLLIITYVQMALGTLIGFAIGLKVSITVALVSSCLMAAFMYLFVWGFKNNKAWAYNATIFLSIMQLPKQLQGFSAAPVSSTIWLAIGIALIAFVWYVRQKLFPEFVFISPKKVKGVYVFSN